MIARPDNEVRWWLTAAVSKERGSDDEYGWTGLGGASFRQGGGSDGRRGDGHRRGPRQAHARGGVVAVGPQRARRRAARRAEQPWRCERPRARGRVQPVVERGRSRASGHAHQEQIADMSRETVAVLGDGEIEDNSPTLAGMLRMRKTALEWSPPIPLPSMLGIDGSLLALANRAGAVELWAYNGGFSHIAAVHLPRPFATELSWSPWKVVDEETCELGLVGALEC